MNVILLQPQDYVSPQRVRLSDYRYKHICEVLKSAVGATLRVGDLNGSLGFGTIGLITSNAIELDVVCHDDSPPPAPITLILALPRPKVLKRILITATTLGIKRICLINTWRVDKSYWSSPSLKPEEITTQLITGLEQARDTTIPVVTLHPRFKPFVEDEVVAISDGGLCYVAHPHDAQVCPVSPLCSERISGEANRAKSITVAVGPEGGFIDYEINKFREYNFSPIELGPRILRVEAAMTKLVSLLAG